MTNDPHNSPGDSGEEPDGVDAGSTSSGYEHHDSESSFDTTSHSTDWNTPTEAGHISDDSALHASAPDSSPLTDGQADVGPAAEQAARSQP